MTADPSGVDAEPPRADEDPSGVEELPAALREPTSRVRAPWVALLVLANLGVWMAFFTPIQVLLPEQVAAIDPAHKQAMLGWVTGLGALAAVVANPVAGALSDRATSRFGRRHPWTLGGALVGAVALAVLATAHTVVAVAVGWVVAQVCFNAMLASLSAAVPDRVPVAQRGAVSGWVGIPQVLGLVLGVLLVTHRGVLTGYLLVALAVVLLALPFTVGTRDDRLSLAPAEPARASGPQRRRLPSSLRPSVQTTPAQTPSSAPAQPARASGPQRRRLPSSLRPSVQTTPAQTPSLAPAEPDRRRDGWRVWLAGFWVDPRRHPDFGWAWLTRFLVQLGNSLGTLYLLYFLTDAVRYPDPQGGLLILILVYTAALMVTTVVAGWRSDRTGRRRIFVVVSTLVMAVAAILLASTPTWPMAVVAATVLGGGYGVYVAVDAALITQVLPAAVDRAKDLGVINIANSAPQVLAPALAAPVVAMLGGYSVLYLLTAVVTVLGGVLVTRIRSVP